LVHDIHLAGRSIALSIPGAVDGGEPSVAARRVAVAPRSCNGRAMAAEPTVDAPQRLATYGSGVADPREVDDALDLAIDRTIDAQDDFESLPPADKDAVPAAEVVVRRAEDVKDLADEAEEPKAK
jgi:hypothetical protein